MGVKNSSTIFKSILKLLKRLNNPECEVGVLKEASSLKQLESIAKEMSRNMECGTRETVVLNSLSLLTQAPKIFMAVDLSLIDAEERSGKVFLVIENRFSKRCSHRKQ